MISNVQRATRILTSIRNIVLPLHALLAEMTLRKLFLRQALS